MNLPGLPLALRSAGPLAPLCDRLAQAFVHEVPLNPSRPGKRKPSSRAELQARTEAGLTRFLSLARTERDAHRLGVIRQARVALGLQQRLLAAGYPLPLVKQVLFTMLAEAFVGRRA